MTMLEDAAIERLATSWEADEDRGDIGVLGRLGLPCPALRSLIEELARHLDAPGGGYQWWPDEWLDDRCRRCIGDYIIASASAVATNLLEARLHQSAFSAASARNDRRVTLRLQPGGGFLPAIKNHAPLDGLAATEIELHSAAVVRAVGSVTDCLAALTIGVAALKTDLVRASWSKMLRAAEADGALISRSDIEALVAGAGPDDWLSWALVYRNTIVHRARRLEFTVVSGTPPASRCDTYLPADPDGTEAEVISQRGVGGRVIREASRTTVPGIVMSAQVLAESLAQKLHEIWQDRAEGKVDLPQPREQWSRKEYGATAFMGYAPGELPGVDLGVMHPDLARRLRAAGG